MNLSSINFSDIFIETIIACAISQSSTLLNCSKYDLSSKYNSSFIPDLSFNFAKATAASHLIFGSSSFNNFFKSGITLLSQIIPKAITAVNLSSDELLVSRITLILSTAG